MLVLAAAGLAAREGVIAAGSLTRTRRVGTLGEGGGPVKLVALKGAGAALLGAGAVVVKAGGGVEAGGGVPVRGGVPVGGGIPVAVTVAGAGVGVTL